MNRVAKCRSARRGAERPGVIPLVGRRGARRRDPATVEASIHGRSEATQGCYASDGLASGPRASVPISSRRVTSSSSDPSRPPTQETARRPRLLRDCGRARDPQSVALPRGREGRIAIAEYGSSEYSGTPSHCARRSSGRCCELRLGALAPRVAPLGGRVFERPPYGGREYARGNGLFPRRCATDRRIHLDRSPPGRRVT